MKAMRTAARITTKRPTTAQEKFQIRRFALTALPSFVITVAVDHAPKLQTG